jgi:hypothetical protein
MCWSKNASLASFILGTIVNIIVFFIFPNKTIRTICIFWQWVLMMQISEYFIWKDQECGKENKLGTKMALFFNIMQPIVLFIVFIVGEDKKSQINNLAKIVASVIIISYMSFMIINLNKQSEYSCTKPSKKCSHLNLKWWNDIKYSGIFYCIVISLLILLLVRPLNISITMLIYIIGTLIISALVYSCGVASMWCFFVVPFPLIIALINKFILKN